jgi:hypothetical protein
MRLILDTLEKILVRGGHLNDERTPQPENAANLRATIPDFSSGRSWGVRPRQISGIEINPGPFLKIGFRHCLTGLPHWCFHMP